MYKKSTVFVLVLLLASMILAACAPAATPVPPTATAVPPTKVPPTATAVPPTATTEPAPNFTALFAKLVTEIPQDKGYGTVAPAALNTELADKAPFLLDVREAAELEKDGFIKGSVNIPVRNVLKNLDKLPAQDQAIVVLCASGHRGAIISAALKLLGYTNVRNLAGGLSAWTKASLAVVKGEKPAEPKAGTAPKIASNALFKALDTFVSGLPEGYLATSVTGVNESLTSAKKPFILDVRREDEFKTGYVAGAVNVPLEKLFASLDKLPAKDTQIVIYCVSGHRAAIGMTGLRLLGYTNVINMGGGMNAWKAAALPLAGVVDWNATWGNFISTLPADFYSISPANLNIALADAAKAPFLLDVREMSEVEKDGFIKGSVVIPVKTALKNLDKLPAQDKPIVVLCASGHRASMVMAALRLLGWKDVKNLGGGFAAWKKAALPVVTGEKPAEAKAGTAPKVDEIMFKDLDAFFSGMPEGFYSVSPTNLNTELADAAKAPVVVDVRTAAEVTAVGSIKGSVMIPVVDLWKNLDKLPKDKTAAIVITCASGHRGGIAAIALRMNGYTNVRNLGGGVNAWVAAQLPVVK